MSQLICTVVRIIDLRNKLQTEGKGDKISFLVFFFFKVSAINKSFIREIPAHSNSQYISLSEQRTCIIHANEALSALRRAKTEECRHKLTTVACLNQEKLLYPKTLPRLCPLKGILLR